MMNMFKVFVISLRSFQIAKEENIKQKPMHVLNLSMMMSFLSSSIFLTPTNERKSGIKNFSF